MTEFEYPGLADKIADALSFQRHAEGLPKSKVAFDRHELAYLHACISFYVSEQMLRRAEKLPLATRPNVHGWTQYDPPGQIKRADGLPPIPDTLPCETEQS